jgi:dihydrofolate reductase
VGPDPRCTARGCARGGRRTQRRPGREILIFGSHILWNDLIATGLIDELHFMIGAGVVGEGVRAFETRPPGPLRLLDTRAFDGSSLLLARYAVER